MLEVVSKIYLNTHIFYSTLKYSLNKRDKWHDQCTLKEHSNFDDIKRCFILLSDMVKKRNADNEGVQVSIDK